MRAQTTSKAPAIILILLGITCRVRAWAILGGTVTAVNFQAEDSEAVVLQKFGVVSDALQQGALWSELSWWFFGAGLALLFGPMLWKSFTGMPTPRRRHELRSPRQP
jgi:hypothetical protein